VSFHNFLPNILSSSDIDCSLQCGRPTLSLGTAELERRSHASISLAKEETDNLFLTLPPWYICAIRGYSGTMRRFSARLAAKCLGIGLGFSFSAKAENLAQLASVCIAQACIPM
jgi:hypothetical protein